MKLEEQYNIEMLVEYEGIELKVPRWTVFLAVDDDGEVCAFFHLPEYQIGMWHATDRGRMRMEVAKFKLGRTKAGDTCKRVYRKV